MLGLDGMGEVLVLRDNISHNGLVGEALTVLRRCGVDSGHFGALEK